MDVWSNISLVNDHGGEGGHGGHGKRGPCPLICYMHYDACEVILFKQWIADTMAAFISSSIGLFLIAILYEGIRYWRDYLDNRQTYLNFQLRKANGGRLKTNREYILNKVHILQCFLHSLQIAIGYWLMLVFMQFNFWLIICVLIGAMIGYYVFAWLRLITFEHCDKC